MNARTCRLLFLPRISQFFSPKIFKIAYPDARCFTQESHAVNRLSLLILCYCLFYSALRPEQCYAQEPIKLYTIEEFDKHGKSVPLNPSNLELLHYLEKSLNLRFDVHRVPWRRGMDIALKTDSILMGMSPTKARLRKYVLSDAINANGNWLITRCDASFRFNDINDLHGKLIGVMLGTTAGDEFDEQINILFKVENDTGAGVARLRKLLLRRMDALVWYGMTSDPKEVQAQINRNYRSSTGEASAQKDLFCVLPKPISVVTNHFAMRISRENAQLIARINQAMSKGRKSGVIPSLNSSSISASSMHR